MTTPTDRQLIDFVVHEARLLDELRLDDWLALFTDDGHYWMPLAPGQTEARLHTSLLYEDKMLLAVRIERLRGARTFSQQPRSRCHHLLQTPTVEARDDAAGVYTTRTSFHFVETRGDEQTLYAGWATHTLVAGDGGALRIRLKRVELVNCASAFGSMQLFM
jgi:3-phenylpropionate/cinnamic acid dioxygenase small subunit